MDRYPIANWVFSYLWLKVGLLICFGSLVYDHCFLLPFYVTHVKPLVVMSIGLQKCLLGSMLFSENI